MAYLEASKRLERDSVIRMGFGIESQRASCCAAATAE